MGLRKTSTDAENPRECANAQCTPSPSHKPRCGTEPEVGDIVCIRMSALVPFYRLLGNANNHGCKPGERPCVITSIKGDGTFTVCLMATFDKNPFGSLPDIIKEFVVLVPTTHPSDKTSANTHIRHIHSTPEWTAPGSGGGLQYIITLPVVSALKPVKKWRSPDMPLDAGYFFDQNTMTKFREIIMEHKERSKAWLSENGSVKVPHMLRALRNLEKAYKSRSKPGEGDRATLTENLGNKDVQSTLSAGFTPFAKGGTEDVDDYIVVGADLGKAGQT
ncbi:hypothetical protein PQX77_012175 [Marasmius sp. AFHP31]|nr:hypothetical protein PQX77_012175 [Marasmius sp. AFHP31]